VNGRPGHVHYELMTRRYCHTVKAGV